VDEKCAVATKQTDSLKTDIAFYQIQGAPDRFSNRLRSISRNLLIDDLREREAKHPAPRDQSVKPM
jgi:hypothetical protein